MQNFVCFTCAQEGYCDTKYADAVNGTQGTLSSTLKDVNVGQPFTTTLLYSIHMNRTQVHLHHWMASHTHTLKRC